MCPHNIYNPILLSYYYRTKPVLKHGEKHSVILPKAAFDVAFNREEVVSTCYGEKSVYIYTGHPSKFTLWLSTDERRLPMRIEGYGVFGYSFILKRLSME